MRFSCLSLYAGSLEDFLKLADKQLPTFCGIKYSDMCLYKFSNILRYSDEKYDVMYGVDQVCYAVQSLLLAQVSIVV